VLKVTTFFSIELRRSGDPTEAIKGVAAAAAHFAAVIEST
jgi:hypothetical protein